MRKSYSIQSGALPAERLFRIALFFFLATLIFFPGLTQAQNCSSTTPVFNINMTGSPDSVWTSPSVGRVGQCCGVSSPDVCVLFNVTLDKNASGIKVEVSGGTGTTEYQVGCSTPVPVGSVFCVSGIGPHAVTVCKPGGNGQVYKVTSIQKAYAPIKVVYITENCKAKLAVLGMKESTIKWNAITGSQYNANLSCSTACDTTIVSASQNFPTYVDYQVCGTPDNPCFTATVCDTIRVYFVPPLKVSISPKNGALCEGNNTLKLTASATGGKAPYKYIWNTNEKTTSINAAPGTYVVRVEDTLNCFIATDTVIVKKYLNPKPVISGDSISCKLSNSNVYSVTNTTGNTYSWNISGGTIISGANTNRILVNWGNIGTGNLSVTETVTATGCTGTVQYKIVLKDRPGPKVILR